jgi:putative ABC transport system permease protein
MFWLNLAWKSAWSRKYSLSLVAISVCLSVIVLLGVQQIRTDAKNSFSNALSGVDLVVGPRGSQTDLLLYSVFQMGTPTQNMPFAELQRIKALPAVAWTIPIQLGDSFEAFPVLGTSIDFFKHYRSSGKALSFKLGEAFQDPLVNPNALMQVVIGSEVAQSKKLKLNDTFALTHGSQAIEETVHSDHPFKLVGILKPTGTPLDRSVLISLESFEALHVGWGLGLRPSAFDAKPEFQKALPDIAELKPSELTAVWVGLHSRSTVFSARKAIESMVPVGAAAPLMAVLPGVALDELWQVVRVVENALIVMGSLVAACSLLGVVSVLLVGLSARRKELAIYRSLGAGPVSIFMTVAWESFLVCTLAIAAGVIGTQFLIYVSQDHLLQSFGIQSHIGWPVLEAWYSIGLLMCGALMASMMPAWRAYRLSLSDGLNPPN